MKSKFGSPLFFLTTSTSGRGILEKLSTKKPDLVSPPSALYSLAQSDDHPSTLQSIMNNVDAQKLLNDIKPEDFEQNQESSSFTC